MLRRSKTLLCVVLCTVFILTASLGFATVSAQATGEQVKNVIILIPDGTSSTATTLARWYNGGAPLALDEMASGLVRTYWTAGAITDSAPAGTALATGYKTSNKFIGILPDKVTMPGIDPIKSEDARKPVATLVEAAKLNGKATGIVATANMQHATPASFSSHYPDRNQYEILAEQQVYLGMDVVLGGGYQYLDASKRKDKEDLIKVVKDGGYDYVTTPEAMKSSTSSKLWGMFAPDAMDYDFDRDPAKQPSLAEMTDKAISVLSKDSDGFFLMVEGSKDDWAAHANDTVGLMSDVLAFDAAVRVALDFAKKDGNTVVLACTDHGTGGISIGASTLNSGYDNAPLNIFIDPLKKAKLTAEGVEKKLNADRSNIVEVMSQYYGISDLTEDEIKAIKETKAGSLAYTVGPMLDKRASIGYTTTGHTGEDQPLYCYHPNSAYKLSGVVQNSDVARYAAKVLGLDLDAASKDLFVAARSAFEAKGATVAWDATDAQNPVVVVTKGSDTLKLPVFKNEAILNGKTVDLDGIVIFNGKSTYVPQAAVDLIN